MLPSCNMQARFISLLPGLGGTCELFEPTPPYLSAELDVIVVLYANRTNFEGFETAAREPERSNARPDPYYTDNSGAGPVTANNRMESQ